MKLKKNSKRQELSQKYNIQHKISAHKKKLRKMAKKSKISGRKKKIAEIPNCIFKEELLRKVEFIKEKKKRDSLLKRSSLQLMDKLGGAQSATPNEVEMSPKTADETIHYSIEKNKIFLESDVVVQVLDCRNPTFFRSVQIEEHAKAMNKKVILVLNKSDLIPRDVAVAWLDHYRKFHPTVLLKCGPSAKKHRNLTKFKSFLDTPESVLSQTSSLVGISELSGLLANYSRTENGERKRILVCLFGYPNVGKSSLVNALIPENKGGHGNVSTEVGSLPGVTTLNKSINIDKYIHLTDTPGQILYKRSEVENALNGVVPLDKINDLTECICFLLSKLEEPAQLYQLLNLESTQNLTGIPIQELADDFVYKYAVSMGKLKKGGVPDKECSAKMFLQKWVTGKIPYYTKPASDLLYLNITN